MSKKRFCGTRTKGTDTLRWLILVHHSTSLGEWRSQVVASCQYTPATNDHRSCVGVAFVFVGFRRNQNEPGTNNHRIGKRKEENAR